MGKLPEISPNDQMKLMVAANSSCLIDVRKRPAFEDSGRILTGAKWHPFDQVTQWSDDLSQDTPIVVYCVHGHEINQGACADLNAARFLIGGFEDFVAAGGIAVEVPGGA